MPLPSRADWGDSLLRCRSWYSAAALIREIWKHWQRQMHYVGSVVIGTGLFILMRPLTDPIAMALPVTALVNALMALPFALRILGPRARDVLAGEGRLGLSLGLTGGRFVRLVLWPRMRPQIGFAAGLTAALSMGDLGVIALFADPDTATLPLQIYRLMGAYRMESAAGAALLLLLLSLALFYIIDRGGRYHAEA